MTNGENGERKIVIVEDNLDAADGLADLLDILGIKKTLIFSTLRALSEAGDTLRGVTDAFIDGNLSRGDLSGRDGAQAVTVIKNASPHARLISISGNNQVTGTDIHLGKPFGINEIEQLFSK